MPFTYVQLIEINFLKYIIAKIWNTSQSCINNLQEQLLEYLHNFALSIYRFVLNRNK